MEGPTDSGYEQNQKSGNHSYLAHVNDVAEIVPSLQTIFDSNNELHAHIKGKCQTVAAFAQRIR